MKIGKYGFVITHVIKKHGILYLPLRYVESKESFNRKF